MQSTASRLEKSHGDSTAERSQLAANVKVANDAIDALLEDEAVDPKVREKVRSLRTSATSNSELAEVRRQLAALEAAREAPAADATGSDAPSPFEQAMVAAIEANGLDPDDALFDWSGEISRLYRTNPDTARSHVVAQIRAGLAAKAQAERRTTRKAAGTAGSKPAGDAVNDLDVGTLEERMKKLRSIGAL